MGRELVVVAAFSLAACAETVEDESTTVGDESGETGDSDAADGGVGEGAGDDGPADGDDGDDDGTSWDDAADGGGSDDSDSDADAGTGGEPGLCGDGMVDPGEECDDAGATDSCTHECEIVGAAELAAGGGHTCVRTNTGEVFCWGFNAYGQLGHGHTDSLGDDETPDAEGPVPVGGAVIQLTAGTGHTCALLQGGTVRCWGAGNNGRLGYGSSEWIGDDETPADETGH